MDLTTVTSLVVARTRADLDALGPAVAPLAGGTWLYSEPQDHLTGLVDLAGLGWEPLRVSDDGLEVGATCTLAELAALPPVPGWTGLGLARRCCDALLGSWKVWGEATVGGNVALALPAGPMTALLTAWEAEVEVWGPAGAQRTTTVPGLVVGDRRTTLSPGEVLRRFRVPAPVLRCRTAFRQASLAELGRSGAVVVGRREPGGGLVVTVTASTPAPRVLRFPALPDAAALAGAVAGLGPWFDDVHGDPGWRAHVTGLLAEQVRAELA
ncbi:FAD binding domain-containing protein [Rhodococcus aerolatus]